MWLDQAADILRGLEPSHEQISAFITVGLTYAKLRAFLVEMNTDLTPASFRRFMTRLEPLINLATVAPPPSRGGTWGSSMKMSVGTPEALDVTHTRDSDGPASVGARSTLPVALAGGSGAEGARTA